MSARAGTVPQLLHDHRPPLAIGARELAYQRFRLRVLSGPDGGREVASTGAVLAIGAAPGNDLVLTDRTVSRHHCEIRAHEDGWIVRDLASTNGTTVGAVRVGVAYLTPGAMIGVGSTAVRFDVDDAEICEPLAGAAAFGDAVGESAAMRRVFAILAQAAADDAPILFEGEPGTGKRLLAAATHRASPRATRALIELDSREPALELDAPAGASLLLVEVGALAPRLQHQLVHAAPRDVRLLATTTRDLREEVNRGRFVADLYRLLSAVRVEVPALRARPEDLPRLIARFLGREPDPALVTWAAEQRWDGNVRELRAAVERGADVDASFHLAKQRLIDEWEREYLRTLMHRFRGNLSRAGLAVSLDRNHLRLLLQRHGIDKKHP